MIRRIISDTTKAEAFSKFATTLLEEFHNNLSHPVGFLQIGAIGIAQVEHESRWHDIGLSGIETISPKQ